MPLSVTEYTRMRPNLPVMIVAAALAVPVAINATEQPAGRDAEKGDPARWEQPLRSPQERYQQSTKEAAAALAEAVKECRGVARPKACISEARAQHKRDLESARAAQAAETRG